MEQASIRSLVLQRKYIEFQKRADEYLQSDDWQGFLRQFKNLTPRGKARDALVSLLELEAVGGTDSDIFEKFGSLEGTNLHEVRFNGVQQAMDILKEQIEQRHTYFIDVEAMAETPYAILVKDVIEARKRELAELDKTPSRIEVLGTFYGFTILMTEGTKPQETATSSGYGWRRYRRRTWLDENITDAAANAVKSLTGQFAEEVEMEKKYRTLGSSPVFKSRCTKYTAQILADAVRLSMYKVPGNRGSAARKLGLTGDSRVLPFLHHRFTIDHSRKVRMRIAEALGRVGDVSSIDVLKDRVKSTQRRISKDTRITIEAIGGIHCPESKRALLEIVENAGNTVKAAAIEALANQDPYGLVEVISPNLEHKSRPVVRASVKTLMDLGEDGHAAIKPKIPLILKRIGYDKPSQQAVRRLLEMPKVGNMKRVQRFFATKLYKLRKDADRWKGRGRSGSYSYWYRRREQRAMRRLREAVEMVNRYLKPPFVAELLNSVEAAVKLYIYTGDRDIYEHLNHSELAQAIYHMKNNASKFNDDSKFTQTYFA